MEWALFALSVALVLATVVLAIFTYHLWQEARAARQPRMVASLDFITPSHVEARFTNAGAGAALDVDLTFRPEGGEERRWAEPVVLPMEGYNVHWLTDEEARSGASSKGLDLIVESFQTMKVVGRYADIRGRTYLVDQTLDARAQWEEVKRARRLAAFRGPLLPFYQLLDSTRRSVEEIARSVETIARHNGPRESR